MKKKNDEKKLLKTVTNVMKQCKNHMDEEVKCVPVSKEKYFPRIFKFSLLKNNLVVHIILGSFPAFTRRCNNVRFWFYYGRDVG